jgi:hypothetical protein
LTKFLISLLLAIGCLVNGAVLAKETGSEWLLKQSTLDLGTLNVFICDDAVKVECPRQGYCVLSKAPDWQVYYYRPLEKTMWVTTLDLFNGLLLTNPFGVPKYGNGSANKVGVIKYAGVNCVQFRPPIAQSWIAYASDEISTNPKVCEFLNRYYYFYNSGRVPVYKKIESSGNKRKLGGGWLSTDMSGDLRNQPRVSLETVSAKRIAYRSADFDVPQNFQRVHNVNDISLSKVHKQQINDLVDSLGFTTELGETQKPKH